MVKRKIVGESIFEKAVFEISGLLASLDEMSNLSIHTENRRVFPNTKFSPLLNYGIPPYLAALLPTAVKASLRGAA